MAAGETGDIHVQLDDLTQEQSAVVTHRSGPAVVIACPGSGKTRTLTHRMAYLVQEGLARPEQILGITFTRAAAGEMKERLGPLLGAQQAQRVRLFTFHGLAWSIVKEARGLPTVLEGQPQQALIRQILMELGLNADQSAVEGVLTDIARFVGGEFARTRYQPTALEPDLFFQAMGRYTEQKEAQGAVDFDDLIVQARALLTSDAALRERLVGEIAQVLVDEVQDTNALQWGFLKLLVPPSQNLMVVGDDDQAIYGWRGASPAFMLNFAKEFPGATAFYLSQNFRSIRAIVGPAAKLIGRNKNRFAKQLLAEREGGHPPQCTRPQSPAEEADLVAEALQAHLAGGGNPAEAAVLYRSSLIAFPLINRLQKLGVPVRVLGGRPHPFGRWMVRDVVGYIKWALGEASTSEVLRLLRRPAHWGITRELLAECERAGLRSAEILPWLTKNASPRGAAEVQQLAERLKQVAKLPAPQVISFIQQEIGYDHYIDQYCEWSGSDPREAKEVLGALEQIPDRKEGARAYLDLASREDGGPREEDDGAARVTLTTFHSAKGLEWERVWLVGAVEGAIPHRGTLESETALEEERRLFYVGMTRAKDFLHITAPQVAFGAPAEVSRFAMESGIWTPPPPPKRVPVRTRRPAAVDDRTLPPPLAPDDYAAGIVCWHAKFGEGVIHRIDERGGVVEVRFESKPKPVVLSLEFCLESGLLRGRPEEDEE